MFRYETTIKVHNMDAARRLFFAEQFVIAHEAWETCLSSVGFSIGRILAEHPALEKVAFVLFSEASLDVYRRYLETPD